MKFRQLDGWTLVVMLVAITPLAAVLLRYVPPTTGNVLAVVFTLLGHMVAGAMTWESAQRDAHERGARR